MPRLAREKRRARRTITRTSELVLEPQVRRFAAGTYIAAALAVIALALGALVAVRELAVIEPILAAEGIHAARAVVYELPVGAELHVPIEPRTDVLRFVVHAYGRTDMPLTPHAAKLMLAFRGDRSSRIEELVPELPGVRARVTPEDLAIAVGDPLAVEVDVHDVGVGELVLKLAEIAAADGLFVRAYRREQLSEAEASLRDTALDRAKKDELARWTWELGWDELTPPERASVLRARWKRIGVLRGASADLRSRTIAIAPPPTRDTRPAREELLGRVALRGDERVALLVHGNVRVRYVSDEATVLRAVWRDANNVEASTSAAGQVEVGPFDDVRSVEVSAARDVGIEVRTSDGDRVEWFGWTNAYRATLARPVFVESGEADRVVRVSLRKPMARLEPGLSRVSAVVELSGGGLAKPLLTRFGVERPRSRVDRYEDYDSPEAPSERAVFFLSLPRGSRARITPPDASSLDISLAELDEVVAPLPMPVRPPDAPSPVVVAETEDTPSAFVPRAPSNAHAFGPAARKVVRTARWLAPSPAPPPPFTVALAHAKHTEVDHIVRGPRHYDGIAKPFDLETETRRPLFVPIVAALDSAARLTVRIERQPLARALPGLFLRWTLARTMDVGPAEMRATFVVGDDVPPGGKLRLHLLASAPPAHSRQLVSLPWVSTRAPGPRWLAGAFEE